MTLRPTRRSAPPAPRLTRHESVQKLETLAPGPILPPSLRDDVARGDAAPRRSVPGREPGQDRGSGPAGLRRASDEAKAAGADAVKDDETPKGDAAGAEGPEGKDREEDGQEAEGKKGEGKEGKGKEGKGKKGEGKEGEGEGGTAAGEGLAADAQDATVIAYGASPSSEIIDYPAPAAPAADAEPPEPVLPLYIAPDLNAIRSPIVRPPPPPALSQAAAILKDTGATPTQHHANIQTAAFQVAEAARSAQRDLVIGIESIAVNARWSVEALAAQIDGIVAQCTAKVSGAAISAYAQVQASAEANMKAIAKAGDVGQTTLQSREDSVRAQVVRNLRESGSDKMRGAHNALVAAYGQYAPEAAAQIPLLASGAAPQYIAVGAEASAASVAATRPDTPIETKEGAAKTFAAAGQKIVEKIFVSPTGEAYGPYLSAYIGRAQVPVVGAEAQRAERGWREAAAERARTLNSEANRNEFILSSLGLVAPTAEAMDMDKEQYQKTLEDRVWAQYGRMSRAQLRAIGQMESLLRGPQSVQAFFDPANPNSLPAKVNEGLVKNGRRIKKAMLQQARLLQATFRASIADLATAYPDLAVRLEEMLLGDDLLDQRVLLPRLGEARGTPGRLLQGQLDTARGKAGEAVDQQRESFRKQVQGLYEATDEAIENITEQKLKAIFHFALMEGFYTGEFSQGLRTALGEVAGYTETAAARLLAPIARAKEDGTQVQRAAVSYFNSQIKGEAQGYYASVNRLGEELGAGETTGEKVLPKISSEKNADVEARAVTLHGLLREPNLKLAAGAGVAGGLGSLVLGPVAGLAGAAVSLNELRQAIPDVGAIREQLSLPWPGALAIEAKSEAIGEGSVKDKIEKRVWDYDGDKDHLLGFFSTSESVAAQHKAAAITEANDSIFRMNDAAVERMAQSFSPTELKALSPEQRAAMGQSIRENLTGARLEITAAYINGNPSQAAAVRVREAMREARTKGARSTEDLTEEINAIILKEARQGGSAGYVSPEEVRQLTDQMYVELDALLPPPGATERAVPVPGLKPGDRVAGDVQSTRDALAKPQVFVPPGPDGKPVPDQQRAAQEQMGRDFLDADAARRRPPDAARVQQAKARFLSYATRDYAHSQIRPAMIPGPMGGLGAITELATRGLTLEHRFDDPDLARAVPGPLGEALSLLGGPGFDTQRQLNDPAFANAAETRISDTQRIKGGVVLDAFDADTARTMEAFVWHGAGSEEYQQARAIQALAQPGGRLFGASQADVVRVAQTVGSPQVSLAEQRLDDARRLPADTAAQKEERRRQIENAQQELNAARRAHDLFLFGVAWRIQHPGATDVPKDPTPEQIAAARRLIEEKTERVAVDYKAGLAGTGRDIVEHGAIDLDKGIKVATKGLGTAEELLTQVMSNRTRAQTDRYFSEGRGLSRSELGIGEGNNNWWNFGEVSGDLALQLETAWVPSNDAERADMAAIKARQQLQDGTGFIASITMADSAQRRYLLRTQEAVRQRVFESIQANKDPNNQPPPDLRGLPVEALFGPDGQLKPEYSRYAYDREGKFYGTGPSMSQLETNLESAVKAYRDEIDRQEAFMLKVIGIAAFIASLVLLLIPGVNLIYAGIAVAVIAGGATIAVKAGMRGNRYGWEEAATDVAVTAIEAATAGVGGAMGGAAKVGRLARFGAMLERSFGKVGSAMVREALVQGTAAMATKALDDRIWDKGIDQGINALFTAGMRGAVTGAVTGGVSQAVAGGLTNKLAPGAPKGMNPAQLSRAGSKLGATGADVIQEVVSGVAGTVSATGVEILFTIAEGREIDRDAVLARLGEAGLKDIISGAARAGARSIHRERFSREMKALNESGRPVTDAQAALLYNLAVSAGLTQAETLLGGPAGPGSAAARNFAAEIEGSRRLLAGMPPVLRRHLEGASPQHVALVEGMLAAGTTGTRAEMHEKAVQLAMHVPGLEGGAFFRDLGEAMAIRKVEAHEAHQAAQAAAASENRVRRQLFTGLDPEASARLRDHDVSEIGKLGEPLQAEARRLVHEGDADGAAVAALIQRATAEGAAVDGDLLRSQLDGLIAARPEAEAAAQQLRARQRAELVEVVPEALAKVVADLGEREAGFLHRTVFAKGEPEPKALENARRMLGKRAPDLDSESLDALFGGLVGKARAQRQAAAEARRQERMVLTDHVPESLRPLLAHLPAHALMALRLAQDLGRMPEPSAMEAWVARAKADFPHLDAVALTAAMRETVAAPAARPSFFERFRQRRALLDFVPKALQGMIKATPILTVPDAVFAAYVGDRAGTPDMPDARPGDNAVTMRLNGEVVVLVRKGADSFALKEEGLHVVQMHDPSWAPRLAMLSEERLEDWKDLPLNERVAMARTVLEAEIAAHQVMLEALDRQLLGLMLPGTREKLARRQAMVEARMVALTARMGELAGFSGSLRKAMEAGAVVEPDWLEQPARLFNRDGEKDTTTPQTDAADAAAKGKTPPKGEAADEAGAEAKRPGLLALVEDPKKAAPREEKLVLALKAVLDQTTSKRWRNQFARDLEPVLAFARAQDHDAIYEGLTHFLTAAMTPHGDLTPEALAKRARSVLIGLAGSDFFALVGTNETLRRTAGLLLGAMGDEMTSAKFTSDSAVAGQIRDFTKIMSDLAADPARTAAVLDYLVAYVDIAQRYRGAVAGGHVGPDDRLTNQTFRPRLESFAAVVADKSVDIAAFAQLLGTFARPAPGDTHGPVALKFIDDFGTPPLGAARSRIPANDLPAPLQMLLAAGAPLAREAFEATLAGQGRRSGWEAEITPAVYDPAQVARLWEVYRTLTSGRFEGASHEDAVYALFYFERMLELPGEIRTSDGETVRRVLDMPQLERILQSGLFESRLDSATFLRAVPHLFEFLKAGNQDMVLLFLRALRTEPPRSQEVRLTSPTGEARTFQARQGPESPDFRFVAAQVFAQATARARAAAGTQAAPEPEAGAPKRGAHLRGAEDKPAVLKTTALETVTEETEAGTKKSKVEREVSGPVAELTFRPGQGGAGLDALSEGLRQIVADHGIGPDGRLSKAGVNALLTLYHGADPDLVKDFKPHSGTLERLPDGAMLVTLKAQNGERISGIVSRRIRAVQRSGAEATFGFETEAGKTYPDLVKVARQLTQGKDPAFRFMQEMLNYLREGGDIAHMKEEMTLAVFLMFGVEVLREPRALIAAKMALIVGAQIDRTGDPAGIGGTELIFGSPEFRSSFGPITNLERSALNGKLLARSEGFGGAEEKVLAAFLFAQRNRLALESGGLFPSTMVGFLDPERLRLLDIVAEKILAHPKQTFQPADYDEQFAVAVILRFGHLVETAAQVLGTDKPLASLTDAEVSLLIDRIMAEVERLLTPKKG